MTRSLHLSIGPRWDELDLVRDRTGDYLREAGFGEDTVTAVAMVAGELCENAVKYGSFMPPRHCIEVEVAIDGRSLTVEVRHGVGVDQLDTLSRLDRMIQWIRGFQDPFEAYLERLKEVSAQTLESDESGLGLVRIAYEGRSVLDFYLDERNVLAVSAVHRLDPRGECHVD